jgi:hypothetical protein
VQVLYSAYIWRRVLIRLLIVHYYFQISSLLTTLIAHILPQYKIHVNKYKNYGLNLLIVRELKFPRKLWADGYVEAIEAIDENWFYWDGKPNKAGHIPAKELDNNKYINAYEVAESATFLF